MELNHKLVAAKGPLANAHQYHRLVGRLIYLTHTRPELGYIVHILSSFMQKPLLPHGKAALRVVRYLKGCPGQGMELVQKAIHETDKWYVAQETETEWAKAEIMSSPLAQRKWTPPEPGWLMCKVGMEYSKSKGCVGGVWVLRNDRGVVLVIVEELSLE